MMIYKYYAFISYSSCDTKWGKRLQYKLEHYRMPTTLCNDHNWKKKTPMRPVFFAPTDIQPGDLSKELKSKLEESSHLIVICSPNSAKSDWVGKEIEYFHSLGRNQNIHFFIVDGTPHCADSSQDCFNPIISKLNLPEILGANIHEKIFRLPWLNRERAYIQLITKLLGIEFDALWNRHRRLLISQILTTTIGTMAVILAVVFAIVMSKPVNVDISLNEITPTNVNLPPLKNAKVSLILPNERKDTTFFNIDETSTFTNVPANLVGKEVQVIFSAENYNRLDTTFILTKEVKLNISRDVNAYGHIHFTLYNHLVQPLPNQVIVIKGVNAISDEKGKVDVIIPIANQQMVYHLTSPTVVLLDTLKDAKCGDCDAVFAKSISR